MNTSRKKQEQDNLEPFIVSEEPLPSRKARTIVTNATRLYPKPFQLVRLLTQTSMDKYFILAGSFANKTKTITLPRETGVSQKTAYLITLSIEYTTASPGQKNETTRRYPFRWVIANADLFEDRASSVTLEVYALHSQLLSIIFPTLRLTGSHVRYQKSILGISLIQNIDNATRLPADTQILQTDVLGFTEELRGLIPTDRNSKTRFADLLIKYETSDVARVGKFKRLKKTLPFVEVLPVVLPQNIFFQKHFKNEW